MKNSTKPTTKKTTKRTAFKRLHSPSDADLHRSFNLYVSAAIEAYRAEEKNIEDYATKDKDWGKKYGNKSINYFNTMLKGMESFMNGKGIHLEGVCDNCGSSQDDCDCTKDDGTIWDLDLEDDDEDFEEGTSDRFGGK